MPRISSARSRRPTRWTRGLQGSSGTPEGGSLEGEGRQTRTLRRDPRRTLACERKVSSVSAGESVVAFVGWILSEVKLCNNGTRASSIFMFSSIVIFSPMCCVWRV